jgi:hypothetical protein
MGVRACWRLKGWADKRDECEGGIAKGVKGNVRGDTGWRVEDRAGLR